MQEYTLRELCEECDVTRRAVQGYEKYGLISPCGKTNRCYLLYNQSAVAKVKHVRALQNYGFKIREIKEYFESTEDKQRIMLKQKHIELNQKHSKLVSYIKEIETLLNRKEN